MEQKRLLIAIGLSFAVFFLWSMFFAPEAPEKTNVPVQEVTEKKPSVPAADDRTAVEDPKSSPETFTQEPSRRAARSITVSSNLYSMTVSEKGAAVVSMVLNDYRETVQPDSAHKELIADELKGGTMIVSLAGESVQRAAGKLFQADYPSDTLDVFRQPAVIRFLYKGANGLQIVKEFRFEPDSYLIGLTVSVFNNGDTVIDKKVSVSLADRMDKGSGSYAFEGPSGFINSALEQVKVKKIKDNNLLEGDIGWLAIESRYFMTSIIPRNPVKGQLRLAFDDGRVTNQLVMDHPELDPQQRETFEFDIFMGPKNVSLMQSFGNQLDKAINFGWVDILAKPCLWFMNFIYGFLPNYGVAIIILTIVTRMIFWPLANKSYKSMGAMRKLQPLMQEIREKNKHNKQKMNQEMMGLYKTYKINPMGGCLPMVIQLPVFFALYRMLYQAIELRHAPFILWMNDLSAPDRLFNFGFKIPFMEAPYGIPVLTLVMAATMFIQQKMTPTPGDPAQAKMMMFLPLIFLFIFINFSSGLVLYWLISNIVSISQQYYIQRKV